MHVFLEALHLRGLSDIDEDSLRNTFANYGSAIEAEVRIDRETGTPRGIGFINYNLMEEAEAAIDGMDGMYLQGRRVCVSYARDFGGGYVGQGACGHNGGYTGKFTSGYNGAGQVDYSTGYCDVTYNPDRMNQSGGASAAYWDNRGYTGGGNNDGGKFTSGYNGAD